MTLSARTFLIQGILSAGALYVIGDIGWLVYVTVAIWVGVECARRPLILPYVMVGAGAGFFAFAHTAVLLEANFAIIVSLFSLAYGATLLGIGSVVYHRVRRVEPESLLESLGLAVVGSIVIGVVVDSSPQYHLGTTLLAQVLGFSVLLLASLSAIGRQPSTEMRFWSLAAILETVVEGLDTLVGGTSSGPLMALLALPYLAIGAASRRDNRGGFLQPFSVSICREFGVRQAVAVSIWLFVPTVAAVYYARDARIGRLVVSIAGVGFVTVIAALRIRLLISLRDWAFEREAELRQLGAELVGMDDMNLVREKVVGAVLGLLSGPGEVAILGPEPDEVIYSVVSGGLSSVPVSEAASMYLDDWWGSRNPWADFRVMVPISIGGEAVEFLAISGQGKERPELQSFVESAASLYSLTIGGHRLREKLIKRRFVKGYQGLAQDSGDLVFVADPVEGNITMLGPTVGRLLGYSDEEFRRVAAFDLVHKNDRSAAKVIVSDVIESGGYGGPVDLRIQQKSGKFTWFSGSVRNFIDVPDIGGLVISLTDIHERKLAEIQTGRSESLYRSLVNQTSDVFVVADESMMISFATPNIERVLGFPADELFGTDSTALFTKDSKAEFRRFLSEHLDDLIDKSIELQLMTKWGDVKDIELRFCDPGVALEQGNVVQVRDISERKALENRLAERPSLDALTALPLRGAAYEEIKDRLGRLRPGQELSVLVVDARGPINGAAGSLGLEHGDALMLDVVNRIRSLVRDTDLVSRVDAFEIAIVSLGAVGDRMTFLWSRIQEELDSPFSISGWDRKMKLSVGCYQTADRRDSPQDVLEAAHIALGVARKESGQSLVYFEPEMRAALAERLALEKDMTGAIDNGEFYVVYQPLVRLDTMRVKGVEALLRWGHPERGFVSPMDFIPIAEQSGAIVPLGRFVLEQSCGMLARWSTRLEGAYQLGVSVNLSVRQLQEAGEIRVLLDIIKASGIDPANLTIELTESILVEDPQWLRANLAPFQQLGSKVAVDDFGTGVAGLNQLREIRFDFLKIDKSYTDRVGTTAEGTKLVEGVVDLGHRVGAAIVAEGIENSRQAEILRRINCEIGQGFFFAKPMTAEKLEEWLCTGVDGMGALRIDQDSPSVAGLGGSG